MLADFPLVHLTPGGEPRVSTEAIALGFKAQHKAEMQLLRKHLPHIEQFGPSAFETRVA